MFLLVGSGMIATLAACGGGGGGGGNGGGGGSTSYTVGGTVTGLGGAGLVLQDSSGDHLAVSAAGSFTFATKVATGGAYGVTVFTQPTSPPKAHEGIYTWSSLDSSPSKCGPYPLTDVLLAAAVYR
jgi:hypothetical protein